MPKAITLRTRITISFMLMMGAITMFIGVAVHWAYEWLEEYIFSESLRNEVQWIEADVLHGIEPSLPPGRRFYNALTVPPELHELRRGYHDAQLKIDDVYSEWHIFVFEINDQRYYLLQNGAYFERLESIIDGFAVAAGIFGVLCAFWIGRVTSARVILPITELAEAVRENQAPFPFQQASDEIGVLARAFAQHSDELREFLLREQCFAGDASHELRTPLAVIAGAAEVMEQHLPQDSGLIPVAERIVRTTQEMQRQLTCLLLLSRDPTTIDKPAIPLCPLVQECVLRCQPYLADKSVHLVLEAQDDVEVHANEELVRSVVWNLLRNACQYTNQGEIHICLQPGLLVVTDTGPGLPSSIDPQKFTRFHSSPRSVGEGLGLSIVQRIVEHLGWRMHVESGAGGCRFTLLLS